MTALRTPAAGLGSAAVGLLLLLLAPACGRDQLDSGTSTNWFHSCVENAECDSELACICGRCTRQCDDTTDCGDGECASELASVVQCEGEETGLICIQPEPESCNELFLESDDGLSPGPAVDCVTGALVCESFDAPFPAEYSTWVAPAPTAPAGRLQDCETFAGDGALHVQTDAEGWAQTRVELAESLTEGNVHARFWAKVSSVQPLPDYLVLFELWNSPEVGDDKISIDLLSNAGLRLNLGPNSSIHGGDPGTFPLDQWVCVELALAMGTDGSAQLSVDGELLADETGVITLPASTPHYISIFGGVPTPGANGFDLLLDELVVATEPIGCEVAGNQ